MGPPAERRGIVTDDRVDPVTCGHTQVLTSRAALLVAGWLITRDRHGRLLWDHWDEVKRGILYRSGQLTEEQLAEAVERYNIRTIVNLQWPGEEIWVARKR